MNEKDIILQAKKDWEKLKILYNENGTTEYGVVRAFVIEGVLQEYVSVNFGNGHCIVFNSIESIK